jgi:hypothetical protein
MLLLTRQRHIFVRRRVGVARDQTESGFPYPGANAIDGRLLPKRREDCALVDELLDPVQRRFTPRAIELARLLLERRVDVRIVAVDARMPKFSCSTTSSKLAARNIPAMALASFAGLRSLRPVDLRMGKPATAGKE